MKNFKLIHMTILSIVTLCFLSFCSPLHANNGFEEKIDSLSKTMADKIAEAGKKKVAVVDFTDLQGTVTELGRFVSEEFSVSLVSAGKGFRVVDRTHLQSIIKENKLSTTGVIDPKTARKLGKIAGVEALVTGSLTSFGDNVRITVKILDTETAEVIDGKRETMAMTDSIKDLLYQGIGIGGAISGKPRRTRRQKSSGKAISTAESGKLLFEVFQCRAEGDKLVIELFITNKLKENQTFYLYCNTSSSGNTIAYDNFGNEYWLKTADIANTTNNFDSRSNFSKLLISDVRTRVKLVFHKLHPDATSITSLILASATNNIYTMQVNLRNMPITE